MAMQSPWEDEQERIARVGRVGGANPSGQPGINSASAGAPSSGPWQGYSPGYLGKTGGAQPGSGWGYYYASSGRPTGAGALGKLAKNFKYETTDISELAKAGQARAKGLIEGGDPEALRKEYYRVNEANALRAGQAAREQELAENADTYAMRGMLGSGGEAAAAADIRRRAAQARLAALSGLGGEAFRFGEEAAIGRLGAGMPWEESDLGRRSQNTEWLNRAIDKRTELARAAAAAAAGGYERILEIPGFGEVPESMMPYIGQMMGML